jgi:ZIP family zinc transporter
VTFAQTVGLGAIAGGTIFIGLPVARVPRMGRQTRVALAMFSAGILAFIFMDVGAQGLGILETHLEAYKAHEASLWPVIGLFALLGAGFLLGVGGIASAQRHLTSPGAQLPPVAGGQSAAVLTRAEGAQRDSVDQTRRGPGWSSRSPSACTTSRKGWRSACRPRPVRSGWPRS